jgi:uncharacterized RDD family membrane protein YckC
MKQSKLFLFKRLASFLIDSSIIYSLSFIANFLLQFFDFYINFFNLFIVVSLIYFPTIEYLFNSSIGKTITGINVLYQSGKTLKAIVFRELLYKQFLVILLIFMPYRVLNLEWMSPLYEILSIGLLFLILFLVTIFTKKSWYDKFAKTYIQKQSYHSKIRKKTIFSFISLALLVGIIRMIYFGGHGSFSKPVVPNFSNCATKSYVDFIENQNDAKDYIFKLFEKNDYVILCERFHQESTQYEFINSLIADKRFAENVGVVCSEVGTSFLQPQLDSLIYSDSISISEFNNQLIDILQNFSFFPMWELTNQVEYYNNLFKLNQKLQKGQKIKHYLTDFPVDWNSIKSKSDYQNIKKLELKRERILAENTMRFLEKEKAKNPNKKCLVIMNFRHAFNGSKLKSKIGDSWQTCASFIIEKYPNKTANILINAMKIELGFSIQNIYPYYFPVSFAPINEGKWDNAFAKNKNKSVGFNFKNSPFGKDRFDMFIFPNWKKLKYDEVFTGMVFYKPLEEHLFKYGYANIFKNNYDQVVLNRAKTIGSSAIDNSYEYWKVKIDNLKKSETIVETNPHLNSTSKLDLLINLVLYLLSIIIVLINILKRKKTDLLKI